MSPSPAQPGENQVLLRDDRTGHWLQFDAPVRILSTQRLDEVAVCLQQIEQAVDREGLTAAGWISYEAAPAFDPALTTHPPGDFPLLWFGLYEKSRRVTLPDLQETDSPQPDRWTPSLSEQDYAEAFQRIKSHIREGDTYQVNFTHRLCCDTFERDSWQTFLRLNAAQQAPYGAMISAGPWQVCSASPELFFRLDGTTLESRPMKGTAPRGLTQSDDRLQAEALRTSEKNRAENLMIVDMVRNDIGRIARPHTVQTPGLCKLEKYPTLWQLTSRVTAETDASMPELFEALFPPASITGAPKARTMEIISELETTARHLYTGAIGFWAPGRRAQFNVAIRTLILNTRTRHAEYGVGGGLVWDSDCEQEQAECRTKAQILQTVRPPFSLLETMRWTAADGVYLLERHLKRLRESADYFDFVLDEPRLRQQLNSMISAFTEDTRRIRLLLDQKGSLMLESDALPTPCSDKMRVTMAQHPVDATSPFLYHKTTHRRVYEEFRAEAPGFDDVILFNEKNEVTETTIANLAVEVDGHLCTPPVDCGLLPGTERAELLEQGILRERVITMKELQASPHVFLLNSVRGMIPLMIE
jgi:para-aminobenzoate synthetase / 4-amino-4-deoxychorismate lyase